MGNSVGKVIKVGRERTVEEEDERDNEAKAEPDALPGERYEAARGLQKLFRDVGYSSIGSMVSSDLRLRRSKSPSLCDFAAWPLQVFIKDDLRGRGPLLFSAKVSVAEGESTTARLSAEVYPKVVAALDEVVKSGLSRPSNVRFV